MATIVTINASDQITNSRADLNTNFANLNSDKIETSVIDTDTTLAANSDAKIPSQKAVKAYIDSGGNVNASTTVRGVVELATSAEITAGTATGATGAALVMTPDQMKLSQNPIVRTYLTAGSPATWTKPAGLKYVIVEVQGGGGGGDSVGSTEAGGGGGGGGYSRKLIAAASLGATETVTTGGGGAAEGNGGTSSFGSHCSATGGTGATSRDGGAAGSGSGGDIDITGGDGSSAAGVNSPASTGGTGGSSFFGGGGAGGQSTGSAGASGQGGNVYGGGGGGEAGGSSTASGTGGAGAAGIVIVTEYYS